MHTLLRPPQRFFRTRKPVFEARYFRIIHEESAPNVERITKVHEGALNGNDQNDEGYPKLGISLNFVEYSTGSILELQYNCSPNVIFLITNKGRFRVHFH